MSSQRGNTCKKGPPKHSNKWGFKNDMNDNSKKIKQINSLLPEGTCEPCKAIIDWKIKYKKYKPLTVPSKCVKCGEKSVKRAYYIVCEECCQKLGLCGKCAKTTEILIPYGTKENENLPNQLLTEKMKELTERERRTIKRRLDKECDVDQLLIEVEQKLKSGDDDDEDFSDSYESDNT